MCSPFDAMSVRQPSPLEALPWDALVNELYHAIKAIEEDLNALRDPYGYKEKASQ